MVDFVKNIFFYKLLEGIENEFIITKANPQGIITYANDLFCQISGYSREELIGKPHNIVRHPDMPKEVFRDMWDTIKNKKKPWKGFVKNKRKDGSHYWVFATIFPILDPVDPNRIEEFISLRKDITGLMDSYENDIIHSKLYDIFEYAYEHSDLKDILGFALDKLLEFPWLEVEKKAGIMLWNEEKQQLEMFVYRGVNEALLQTCHIVPSGKCLCGLAALKRELIYKSHIDDDHHNFPEGMLPHGHYNVPLIYNNKLLGVVFLYLEDGHKQKEIETKFLDILAKVLSSIIYQFELHRKIEEESVFRFLMLQYVKQYSSKDTYLAATERINNIRTIDTPYLKNRYLHLMFLDIANFTGYSEKHSAEEVVRNLNTFFSPIIDIIYKNHGDIDKFIGDAIFCYFENPLDCLDAGLKILKYTQDALFKVKIGIHSGFVSHADIGNDYRKDFTLIGDVVNTTQRIQNAAKESQMLISQEFYNHVKEYINTLEDVDVSKKMYMKAKHKEKLIGVYRLMLKAHKKSYA